VSPTAKIIAQTCTLCGIRPATTSEHIPPESFFEPPYPANLITVPACAECNNGSERDDEYVRTFLAALDTPNGTPTLERIRERVNKRLGRPEYPGLRRRLINASELSTFDNPLTGVAELRAGTRPESDRLQRTFSKQARGLMFHLTGQTIPRSRFIMLERVHNMQTRPPEFWEMWVGASQYALGGITGSVGDVFRYAYRDVKRSACEAVVRLEFYGIFPYVALIFKKDFSPTQRVAFPF
jgi:hypothetical protein